MWMDDKEIKNADEASTAKSKTADLNFKVLKGQMNVYTVALKELYSLLERNSN